MKKLLKGMLLPLMFIMNAMQVMAAEGSGSAASDISWGMVIIVALIVAIIACLIASGSMKSVHTASSAKHYEKPGSFTLSGKSDNYTHTTEQRIHHESQRES